MCILIVDDEPITRLGAALSFQDAGHEVMEAIHGRHAIAIISQHPCYFSALVTDFEMPHGVTGAHVIEHMREEYSDIPMVLTTGLHGTVTPEWLTHHDVTMLMKPYALEELIGVLTQLLS